MKNISILLFGAILFLNSCSGLLDTDPKDLLVREDFWRSEDDVEASMIGAFNQIQSTVNRMIVWGEARSGYINYSSASSSLSSFNRQDINELNSYVHWGDFYKVINYVNTIIRFAPDVPAVDDQYSERDLNNHLGEAYYLRAFMHFYLIRSFLEVPYVDMPYDNDGQDFYVEFTSRDEVFNKIVEDLLLAKSLLNTDYSEVYEIKGRVTEDAVNATLADVYLWMGQYQNALDACKEIQSYSLVSKEKWFNIFFEGNNLEESIFELQFSTEFKDYMPTSVWSDIYLKAELEKQDNVLWPALDASIDSRVLATAVKSSDDTSAPMKLWKWIGTRANGIYSTDKRNVRDCNWIFYRYADVVLMKAEALNNLGNTTEALEQLNLIRERVNVPQYDLSNPDVQVLDELILDERGRELAFEGKRWFDLVRFALRYGDLEEKTALGNNILIERIVTQKAQQGVQGAFLRFKIQDPKSWFLPIHYDELQANPNLRQFEYYMRSR